MKEKILISTIIVLGLATSVLLVKNNELRNDLADSKNNIALKSEESERLKSIINYFTINPGGAQNEALIDTPMVTPAIGGYTGIGVDSIEPSIQATPPSQGTTQGYSGREEIMIDEVEMESYPDPSNMDSGINE